MAFLELHPEAQPAAPATKALIGNPHGSRGCEGEPGGETSRIKKGQEGEH